jgi:hypothetical protein
MVLSCGPALAQASMAGLTPAGRYGLDAASCRAGDIFATLTTSRIDLPTVSCTGVDYDQTGNAGGVTTWSVSAKACFEEGATRGKPMRFRITREAGGAIRFHWADGTRSGTLTRCR